ncbi:MAG: AMP-binding protein [Alphaproteobacteria bacterium]|nr:AMP-binding protein [Alphaproteobacteria bacterium]
MSEITYGNLDSEIQKRVKALDGVSVLAIALDNSVEWVLWDLAALMAGIPSVPLPPFFTQEQVFHSLLSAGVSHILSSEGLRTAGERNSKALPKETAKVTFTSGTTGSPKGVCLPVIAMENVAVGIVDILGAEFAGIHASILPLSVLLENVAGVYAGLMAGCTIELTSLQVFGKNYEHLHEVLLSTGATSVILVPEILRILMVQVLLKGSLPDLKFIAVGGSKIAPALITQSRTMGLPVYEGYGLSECASVVALNTPHNDKPGTVGKLLPHVKARIIDGEIQIKNPGFLGYIGESVPILFPTGDLGAMGENGFLSITGRSKNVLITSYGRNISPEWVEATLLAQPAIAQAIVYGDAAPHLSALIVPSYQEADIESAVSAANQTLPDYAQIKSFQIVSPFTVADGTLTGTGRPRRDKIMNLYAQKEKNHEFLRSVS